MALGGGTVLIVTSRNSRCLKNLDLNHAEARVHDGNLWRFARFY